MINGKTILALIPARSGSKGIPFKNIKEICGKPLIGWTIEEAKKSNYLDRIVVSTDSPKIADVSTAFGAEVPFFRPKSISGDYAKSFDTYLHAVNWFREKKVFFDYIIVLQPTSPLRTVVDIDKAIETLSFNSYKAIVSVCESTHHPLWANELPDDKCMNNFIRDDVKGKNRQELPIYYQINGAIYIADCEYLIENNGFISYDTYAIVMDLKNSIDIDNDLDFMLAELLLKQDRLQYSLMSA